ncbi:MAG: HD domain-containing protein [Proteobacteria bacterium]|nr:HD domain-containing protein [Pseudomonadota bacterium]
MNKNISVDHYVHRILIRKLFLVSAILLLIVAGYAYWQGMSNFKGQVGIIVDNRLNLLKYQLFNHTKSKQIPVTQAILETIKTHDNIAFSKKAGFFAYGSIRDAQRNSLVTWYNKDITNKALLDKYINTELSSINIEAHQNYEQLISIGNQKALLYIRPFYDYQGNLIGQLKTIFVISPTLQEELTHKIIYAFLFGCLLIITIFSLIYPVVIKLTSKLGKAYSSVLDANLEMMQLLGSAIAKRDSDTSAHNYRVTLFSVRLAEHLRLPQKDICSLIKGAFLHDIGKIGISDLILLKPGKLTEEEFEVMKTHVTIGSDIIKRSAWLQDANDVVLFHHEKVNGSGYPNAMSQNNIPLNACIFAIADVFDALTSKRPYKEPFPFGKAMDIMNEGKGSHFDQELLEKFQEIAEELYQNIVNLSLDQLRTELNQITNHYFHSSLEDIKY